MILVFSVVFLVGYGRTVIPSLSEEINRNGGNGAIGTSISVNAPVEDIETMPSNGNPSIGEYWIGPSGQTYIATIPNPATVAVAAAVGITVTVLLKPVDEKEVDEDEIN
ncbi:MAG: hypothetical protein WC306_01545 [Candidatus Paceibacterota bacterium]